MSNIELTPLRDISAFRKLALGTWVTAKDPSVYGSMDVRMEKSIAYMEAFRARTGVRLTVTHLVAKALADALQKVPEACAIQRFSRIYVRDHIDLSILVVQTDLGKGKVDLAAAKIKDVDKKSLYQLAQEIEQQVQKVRAREDAAMEAGKSTTRLIPNFLVGWFLDLVSFLMYTLNLDLTRFNIPRDPFGGATVTNIGSLGLDTAYVPLVPYTRVPIFIAPGAIKDAPVVEGDRVIPGKVMRLNATFDHRFIDGYHTHVMAKTLGAYFEDPFQHFDPIESLPVRQS